MGAKGRVGLRLASAGLAGIGLAALVVRGVRNLAQADLAGQVVLVTGGSRGLGLLLAREFGRNGAQVAICARNPEELDRARGILSGSGIHAQSYRCDLTDPAQVGEMVATIAAQLGPVEILVNNAGVIEVGPAAQMTLEDYQEAMAVNFWAALHTTLAVLPAMRRRHRGRIVNIGSIGARVPVPHLLPYVASKFALRGLSEGLRVELAKDGIAVTTVHPGLMRTGSPAHALFKSQAAKEYAWFLLGASTPLFSMDAERAARAIVSATRRGQAQLTLTVRARLLGLVHDLFPATTLDLLGSLNWLMPTETPGSKRPGRELGTALSSPWLARLSHQSASRYNELATPPSADGG